ncbi:MAG: DNA cytosine methyltransferase [Candidatus Obscuribacterales bacterium]|nr:DNA cytosine methyltransferase [Candidatus Obscuribacterales bacterium]
MKVLSLFTGAGGLDVGLEIAGFQIAGAVEIDNDAKSTLQLNRPNWKLAEPGDLFTYRGEDLLDIFNLRRKEVCVLSGGPPCQPFSKSSYWNGDTKRLEDPRARTIKSYLQVCEAALPYVVLLENVDGLLFQGKDEGLKLILRQIGAINTRNGTKYLPQIIKVNAADFGAPQRRERVFLLAFRDGRQIQFPEATHTDGKELPLTAWDAIGGLNVDEESLALTGKWADLLPSIPEGYNYLWHTERGDGKPLFNWRSRYWTFLLKLAKNRPSWTLQAQPGPATGPFHWDNRRLSVEEMCRLQTFPDDYEIVGSYGSARKQVGNAVPCMLGELIGLEIRRQIFGERVRRKLKLIPERRFDCPPAEPVKARFPKRYWELGNAIR